MVNITAEIPELAGFARNLSGTVYQVQVIDRMVGRFAFLVERFAKVKVRKRTKMTAQSIATSKPEPMVRAVSVHNLTGPILEFGSAPHTIVARNASALMLPITPGMNAKKAQAGVSPFTRTYGPRGTGRLSGATRSGQVAFVFSVQHPGTQAYPFMIPAFDEAKGGLEEIMAVAAGQILRHMAGKGELGALAQVTGL